jgi:hypothetical protein
MKPVVNLEETPGKVVGRDSATAADHDRLMAASEELMPRLPFPKGVYKFCTHEEADAWMEQHILRAALNKARARHDAAT